MERVPYGFISGSILEVGCMIVKKGGGDSGYRIVEWWRTLENPVDWQHFVGNVEFPLAPFN